MLQQKSKFANQFYNYYFLPYFKENSKVLQN